MTLEDVQAAKAALEAEGQTPSYNQVLARLGHGSKRDVARLMQQLTAPDAGPSLADDPRPDLTALGAAPDPASLAALIPAVDLAPLLPDLTAPLHRARQARDQTAAAEHALGVEEARLKRQRQALDDTRQTLAIGTPGQPSDGADLERRCQVREVLTQLETVEAARRAVHLKRQAAAAARVEAHDAYDALQGQAARWLRRLRHAQREAQASPSASQRGDAREEGEHAMGQVAALVGQGEAQRCAEDATYQPDWLRG